MSRKKLIIAVTGASGSVYASRLIERVSSLEQHIEECVLIFSENGKQVWKYELDTEPLFEQNSVFRVANVSNMFDAVASGSAGYDTMIVIPCSMGTLARIACGISDNLICRAADVILKEKRSLILVPREAPLSSIHLKNMSTLDSAGAVIFPASPFFYHKPKDIDSVIDSFVERIAEKIGLPSETFRWGTND